MLVLLPRLIRKLSMPELLVRIDPGITEDALQDIAPGSTPGAPVPTTPGLRDPQKLQKSVGFIDSLLRYRLFQRYGKCLLRSLVLFRFLRIQGWPVEIHFGVRKTTEGLNDITGHSWLVLDGEPFLEADTHETYSTTFVYSGQIPSDHQAAR
ncbi:MAG: lasso peptide biosynthesis B2 protein [Thermoleophilia bacterium]